jgi:hypothetical protein
VTEPVVRILVLNAGIAVLGLGLLPLLGIARTPREFAERCGLAYLCGFAVVGVVGTDLPILGVPLTLPVFALLVGAVFTGGALRMRGAAQRGTPAPVRARAGLVDHVWVAGGIAGIVATAVLFLQAGRAFVLHPLGWKSLATDYDSWAIWALKARALTQLGDVHNDVFTSHAYALSHLDYPLAYPSLQALDYRAMGSLDTTTMHVQLILLAAGFVAAVLSLLGGRTPLVLLVVALLVLFTTPMALAQLETGYADMPLAFMIAAGVAGLARYVLDGERFAVAAAALFLGTGALTKNEGMLFALLALVAAGLAILAGDRRRLRPLGLVALVVVAIVLPWRIWVAIHPAPEEYRFSSLLDPSYLNDNFDRARISFWTLRDQLGGASWAGSSGLLAAGAVCAALARRLELLVFGAAFLVFGLLGLTGTYWIAATDLGFLLATSSYRTVDTLVVSGVVLAAVGAGEAWRLVAWRSATDEARSATGVSAPGETRDVAYAPSD